MATIVLDKDDPHASIAAQAALLRRASSAPRPPPLPLTKAAAAGDVGALAAALRGGAAIDAVDPACGGTALHVAAKRGEAAAVAHLLDAGADRTAKDAAGATARERAADDGKWVCCALLGAGPDDPAPGGRCARPPLQGALLAGDGLCANQPLVWDVGAKLQKSLARSNRSRFG